MTTAPLPTSPDEFFFGTAARDATRCLPSGSPQKFRLVAIGALAPRGVIRQIRFVRKIGSPTLRPVHASTKPVRHTEPSAPSPRPLRLCVGQFNPGSWRHGTVR